MHTYMCIYIYIHMLRTSEIGHSEDLSPNSSVGSIHTNVYIYIHTYAYVYIYIIFIIVHVKKR